MGPGSLVCFPNIGTQSLLWCTVMADSTAPACGSIPQCPDSTEVATTGEDAVPETGSRAGMNSAETSGRGGMRVEGSAAQVMACRDTQLWLSTEKGESPVAKMSADTLQEGGRPDSRWQVMVTHSSIHHRPAEWENAGQSYCIFHCRHTPKNSLQPCSKQQSQP